MTAEQARIGGNMADRRRLMELAHAGTRQSGNPAAEALCELLIVTGRVLESLTDGPVEVYMAVGDKDVQELRVLMTAMTFEEILEREG